MKITDLKDIPQNYENGFMFALYRTKIVFGMIEIASVYLEDDLLEMHIFNSDFEYRAMQTTDGAKEVVISDNSFKNCEIIDDRMMLYGKSFISQKNGVMTVSENDREFSFFLPYEMSDFNKGIYLKVKNYYSFDENDLLYLKGYRLCGIEFGGEENA